MFASYAGGDIISWDAELSSASTFDTKCIAAFRAESMRKRYSITRIRHASASAFPGTCNQMKIAKQLRRSARVRVVISRKRRYAPCASSIETSLTWLRYILYQRAVCSAGNVGSGPCLSASRCISTRGSCGPNTVKARLEGKQFLPIFQKTRTSSPLFGMAQPKIPVISVRTAGTAISLPTIAQFPFVSPSTTARRCDRPSAIAPKPMTLTKTNVTNCGWFFCLSDFAMVFYPQVT